MLLLQLHEEPYHTKGVAIHNLRRAVREQFTDLRNNARTVKIIWEYVNQLIEDPHSPVDLIEEVAVPAKAVSAKGKGRAAKRKRVDEDEDDDGSAPRAKASSSKSRPKAKVS